VTIGTIGITIQVAIMYYRNLAHKFTGDMWHEGNALLHIYHLEPLTNSVGELMASYPLLLTVATYAWVTLLALCVLLFVQTRAQPLVNTAFIVGHILILMTLNIGLFAWVAIGVHLLFYRERAINWADSQMAKMGGNTDSAESETTP
jgi:hypothetical protein